jgi:hypothetical protein
MSNRKQCGGAFTPQFQAGPETCRMYQEEGSYRTLQPQGPMTATEQQMCDGYFFMSKQPRPGTANWAAKHPGKLGGRRRGTRKGRKGTRKGRKGSKSRRNRH